MYAPGTFGGVAFGLLLLLLAIGLPVAAIVWAVNLSASVHAIMTTLARMEQRDMAEAAKTATPAPVPAAHAAEPAPEPVDIEPFVD